MATHSKVLSRSRRKRARNLIDAGRFADAKLALEQLCRADHRDAETWFLLAATNGQLGLLEEALACCGKATSLAPDHLDAHYNLGQALLRLGRPQEAIAAYRRVLELRPDHVDALHNLAYCHELGGDFSEACRLYGEVLNAEPDWVDALNNLGNLMVDLGEGPRGIALLQRAVQLRPDFAKARVNLGFALLHQGRLDEADACFAALLECENGSVDALVGQAAVSERRGDYQEAHQLLAPLLDEAAPELRAVIAFAKIAKHVGERSRAIELLEGALHRPDLDQQDSRPLQFNLGHLYDGVGDYDAAFAHFDCANRNRPVTFTVEDYNREIDAIESVFTREFLAGAPKAGLASDRPVFIVGMPRSGTSLVEQILASHPAVFGAGELTDIHEMVEAFRVRAAACGRSYPTAMGAADVPDLDGAARRYLGVLERLSPEHLRVTDKMPHNFMHLGLIQMVLPGARVIHCRRHPLDTCLSIYFHDFNAGHGYAVDLAALGEHYRRYEQLMAHWRKNLSLPLLELQYEELVADQEAMTRRLVEFCGLEWDSACLRFHESRRTVNTFSYDQVRRPMYTDSVARWRRYERHLGPLMDALGIAPDGAAQA